MHRVIWWLRRDLRVTDNITWHYALRDASSVIPVFILDPRLPLWGELRRGFLLHLFFREALRFLFQDFLDVGEHLLDHRIVRFGFLIERDAGRSVGRVVLVREYGHCAQQKGEKGRSEQGQNDFHVTSSLGS
jgi:deoxyribodipyrimidine photolyase